MDLGVDAIVLEADEDVGGTWYRNRYPGCRFDSESYTYGYSFSEELLQEWDWKEHFSAQPDTLRYLQRVADKFDLRRDIRFGTRVAAAHWDDDSGEWEIATGEGDRCRARYLITAVGELSATQLPNIEGIHDFEGEWHHTSQWPKEPVDFAGRRVGIIGTGATGVQVIQTIASEVGHLTVFQRTANYCCPLRNSPITEEEQAEIKAGYPELFARLRETYAGFIHDFDPRSALEVSEEERLARYEELWAKPGFGKWLSLYHDVIVDLEANATMTEFWKEKLRERVRDPEVAEKLIPKDHPFGTKRVPLETNYYEVYNRDNVLLVDVREDPIERITARGVKTRSAEYPLDMLIYATGFDTVTGSLDRIDIRGKGGQSLKEKWADGPRNYLGFQSAGFPNIFTLVGPHNGSTFCNLPRCIEQNVEWVDECLRYMEAHGHSRIEATREAEEAWNDHVQEGVRDTLFPLGNSWFFGANTPGKKVTFLMYANGMPVYRAKCEEVAAKGYEGFVLS